MREFRVKPLGYHRRPWPRKRPHLSRSSSTSSGPSSPGSASTFDPASLETRLAELEEELNAPGLWDDQARAAKVSADHARVSRRLEGYRALTREYEDARELAELDGGEMEGEIASMLTPLRQELDRLQEAALFNGEYDAGDAVVTLQSGTGGTDAQDWAEMMLRMYERWAANRGFKVELLEASPGEEAGIKSATFRAEGENAYGLYSAEKGVHRLVRLSPFDSANRRQTSFAAITITPDIDDDIEVDINEVDLKIDTYRAGGAGGQHVNKTDSAVRITHRPTGIVVQCQNERSQSSNRATAMAMLRAKLIEAEERRRKEEIARERGEAQDVNFGSQIRSYVLHPYTMVKDHRTDYEVGNANGVLDGDLDGFVRAWLESNARSRT